MKYRARWRRFIGITLVLTMALSGLTTTQASAAPDQTEAENDLKQIGLALANYYSTYQQFPPAYYINEAGDATVSWRVLILPFLGEADLYQQFDLEKPWDDSIHLPLLDQMPEVFRGVAHKKNSIFTGYAGVFGPNQAFQDGDLDNDGLRFRDFTDGLSFSFMAGAVGKQVEIPWSAPGDVMFGEPAELGDKRGFDGKGNSVPMLFADGSVQLLSDRTPSAMVAAYSTINGREVLEP